MLRVLNNPKRKVGCRQEFKKKKKKIFLGTNGVYFNTLKSVLYKDNFLKQIRPNFII